MKIEPEEKTKTRAKRTVTVPDASTVHRGGIPKMLQETCGGGISRNCNRKRQIIKCKVENCSQLFEEVTALLKHIRESHGADEVTRFRISEGSYWPIRCHKCEHGFTNQSALDKHIEHKDGFPFSRRVI